MVTLELEQAQADILRRCLESNLSDLSVEIAGTDRKSYRDEIKAEREVLRAILDRLGKIKEAVG